MSSYIYAGAVAPQAYVVDVVPGDSGVDLSTVSSAIIVLRLENGSIVSWTGTLSNQSVTTLTVTHTMTASDTLAAGPGSYRAYVLLTIPSGSVRTDTLEITVRGEFDT